MNDGVLEVVGLGGAYSEALVRLYVSHGKRDKRERERESETETETERHSMK